MSTQTMDVVEATSLNKIPEVVQSQRNFFRSGLTKDAEFRIEQLKKLRKVIVKREKDIYAALKADLNKHPFETYGTEVGLTLNEIDHCIKSVRKWMKPRKVKTSLFHFKGSSRIHADPYGVALIIAPWNYPFQLQMLPLIGAMAAGNCVTIKPSELASATSHLIAEMVAEAFDPHYISVFEGGIPVSQKLLDEKFDYIFFTGSTQVGRIVYQAAAKHLTPVTLELGGKSPCIVDENVDLEVTAKRLAWGKLVNNGQTCIAPDYLMVRKSVKQPLLELIKKAIERFYGRDPKSSPYYGRIINERHFKRISQLILNSGKIVYGGEMNADEKYISPTILDDITPDSPIMKEEIFGPVLPVMEYENIDEVIGFINERPKPLALYLFSKNDDLVDKVLKETSSGGSCINDTLMHIANPNMSFGGVGESGVGGYHGKHSFDAFSHDKSVMHKSFFPDPPIRYAPYKTSLKVLKFLISKFG